MTTKQNNNTLFVSALKEAVRHYSEYFYLTGDINEIDSMWDMQPHYGMLEHLLLEPESTQQFISAIWSFFKPLNLGSSGFADSIRSIEPWQREILSQMILNDPLVISASNKPVENQDVITSDPNL